MSLKKCIFIIPLITGILHLMLFFCGDPTKPDFDRPPEIENGKAIVTSGALELDSAYLMYIEATGLGTLTYQWYKNSDAITGATHDTLVFPALSFSDTGMYYCIVSNEYGSDTSLTDTLRITIPDNSPPLILNKKAVLHSGSQQFDSLYTIYIQAVGGGTLTYQWYKNNSAVTNAKDDSLEFSPLLVSDTGVYHCIVTNAFGSDTSLTDTITYTISDNTPPSILNGQAIQTSGIPEFDSAYFMYIQAIGSDTLKYQWYKNGAAVSNETDDTLLFTGLTFSDTGTYQCIVTNPYGSDTSLTNKLQITVTDSVPTILHGKVIQTSGVPKLDSFFVLYVDAVGRDTLNFLWYKNDTIISRFESDSMKFSALEYADSGVYHCIVSNKLGSDTSLAYTLHVVSDSTPPVILNNKAILTSGTPKLDSSFVMYIQAIGSDTLKYQWYKNNSPMAGNTDDSLKFSTLGLSDSGVYQCFVMNVFGSDTSNKHNLRLNNTNPKYTVTFDSKGGSAVVSQTVDSGGLVAEPVAPTYTGYNFVGWFKESTCINAWLFSSERVTSDITLYAKWSKYPVFTVKFNSQGGSLVDSQSVDSGGVATKPIDPTYTGYTFGGWFKEPACSNSWLFNSDKIISNVVLFAKWTAVIYSITYHLDGGNNPSGNPDSYTIESHLITFQNPSKSGFIFEGWYSDPGFNNQVTGIPAGSTGDIELYAKWGWSYTVTFDGQGATTDPDPASITVTSPATTIGSLPSNPIKTGYTFGGWFTAINGGGTAFTAYTIVTGNITVFAKWTINTFTVNFNSHGGTYVDSYNNVPYNSTIKEPTPPTLSQYTFMGWYKDQAYTDDWDFDNDRVTSTITLHAKWEKTTYVLTIYVSPTGYGTVTPASGTAFDAGTVVRLKATSANVNHYAFNNWTGDASGNNSSTTVTMDRDKIVTANFIELTNNAPIVEELVMNFTYVTLSTESQFTFKIRDNDGDVMHWQMLYESSDGGVVKYTPSSGDITGSGEQYLTVIGVATGTFTPKLVVSDDYGGSTIETSDTRAILDMKK